MRGSGGKRTAGGTEALIGNLLRTGVMLSAAVVLSGAVVFLWRHGREIPDYRVFHGEESDLRTLSGIARGVWSVRGRALIQLGLLLLIATPVARVALSVMAFIRERDWLYAGITLVVLSLLLFGLLGGSL